MKILLTGSNGFLGKMILNHFSSFDLITVGRKQSDIYCDFSLSVPSLFPVDLVINSFGKAHFYPKTKAEEQFFFNINVNGTLNLLKGLENSGIPKSFVFISSVAVYGLDHGNLINEDFPLVANDPYGLSKIEAENLVLEWCIKHNVVCTIFRLPLIVGLNPPGNLGLMIDAIKKGYYFNVDGGKAKKSMVLGEDVSRFILKASEIGGIYNLTDGYHPTFLELSNLISYQLEKGKPMNIPLRFAKTISNFGDFFGNVVPLNSKKLNKITSDLTFDDSKARAAFGWKPTPVLEDFKIN